MPLIEDSAVCVRVWDWSETSQTAVLMTREHGMVRVLAKGSKRERSAFSGGLELCTQGQFAAIVKPNADLALLTIWDLEQPMLGIRQNLSAYHSAMLGVDLIPRLIQDHDPHPAVFDSLMHLLDHCQRAHQIDPGQSKHQTLSILAWYQWAVLVAIGAMPVVGYDVMTGELLQDADVYGFSAQLGGVTQDPITMSSNQGQSRTMTNGVWRVRAETIQIMHSLGEDPEISKFMDCSPDQITRVASLLGAYIRERTGTDIPAMNWLISPSFDA
ncbi:MAG: DNA repair protein RecO [Phycisphaerales bacterium]